MTPPREQSTTIETTDAGSSDQGTTLAKIARSADISLDNASTVELSAADVLAMGDSSLSDEDLSMFGDSQVADQTRETPTARQLKAMVDGKSALVEDIDGVDVDVDVDVEESERLLRRDRKSPPRVVKPRKVRSRIQARRQGGVAPYVAPPARRTRRHRRRDYRRQGFIELTQEPQKRRHRILPRTVIGISVTMMALGVGAAFAAASLYAYYDYRLSQNEVEVAKLVEGFDAQFNDAEAKIVNLRDDAIGSINESLTPLEHYADIEVTMADLSKQLAPSVWFVETLDSEGKPSVGSAFVVASDRQQSLLLTSYSVVRQATTQPAPPVILEYAGSKVEGQVYTWDEVNDLALITIELGDLKTVEWAPNEVNARAVGRPVFAVSGLGGAGASLTDGRIVDNSFDGIQHTAVIGDAWRGSPLVNSEGQVLAVGSLDYQPLGFDPGAVRFAPHVSAACDVVLTCSEEASSTGGPALADASGNGAEPIVTVPEAVED